MRKIPLIIDCDPGTDDAVALGLSLFCEQLDVKLITTVCGSVPIGNNTTDTLHLLDVFNKNIPVGQGASRPLLRKPPKVKSYIEGLKGLGSYVYDNTFTNKHISGDAVSLMYKTLRESKEKVTILALGPLTNIASLFADYPDSLEYIQTVYVAGGSIDGSGNYTAHAEFNFHYDPHAAQLVLNSGLDIRVIPIQTGLCWRLKPSETDKLAKINRTGELFSEILRNDHREHSHSEVDALFDATALVCLLKPELFVTYDCRCKVELVDKQKQGMLICDYKAKPNCKIVSEGDADEIKKYFYELIKKCSTQKEQTRPIMIDCDPGVDDAMALMNALYSPQVRTLLITSVGGNTTSDVTGRNALHIVELCHRKTPVAYGESFPLYRKANFATYAHGENGLGGYSYKTIYSNPLKENAVDAMYNTLLQHKDQHITLLSLGPMTNIASLIRKYPDCRQYIRKIVFMGGTKEQVLTEPYNEFNICFDPEATGIVLDSGIPLVMVPMEMGHMAYLSHEEIKQIKHTNKTGKKLAKMFEKYYDHHVNIHGAATHDSCTLFYLTHPEHFKTEKAEIIVREYDTEHIFVDVDYHSKNPNALVCVDMDIEAFKKDFFELLKKMD